MLSFITNGLSYILSSPKIVFQKFFFVQADNIKNKNSILSWWKDFSFWRLNKWKYYEELDYLNRKEAYVKVCTEGHEVQRSSKLYKQIMYANTEHIKQELITNYNELKEKPISYFHEKHTLLLQEYSAQITFIDKKLKFLTEDNEQQEQVQVAQITTELAESQALGMDQKMGLERENFFKEQEILKKEIETLKKENTKLNEDLSTTKQELFNTHQKAERLGKISLQLGDEREQLRKEKAKLDATIVELNEQITELSANENRITTLEFEKTELIKKHDKIRETNGTLIKDLRYYQNECDIAKKNLEEKNKQQDQEKAITEKQLRDLQEQLKQEEAVAEQAKDTAAKYYGRLNSLRERCNAAEQMCATLAGDPSYGLFSLLKKMDQLIVPYKQMQQELLPKIQKITENSQEQIKLTEELIVIRKQRAELEIKYLHLSDPSSIAHLSQLLQQENPDKISNAIQDEVRKEKIIIAELENKREESKVLQTELSTDLKKFSHSATSIYDQYLKLSDEVIENTMNSSISTPNRTRLKEYALKDITDTYRPSPVIENNSSNNNAQPQPQQQIPTTSNSNTNDEQHHTLPAQQNTSLLLYRRSLAASMSRFTTNFKSTTSTESAPTAQTPSTSQKSSPIESD